MHDRQATREEAGVAPRLDLQGEITCSVACCTLTVCNKWFRLVDSGVVDPFSHHGCSDHRRISVLRVDDQNRRASPWIHPWGERRPKC
jgi:hypothetical protein